MNKTSSSDTELDRAKLRAKRILRPVSAFDVSHYRLARGRLQPLRKPAYVGEIASEEIWFEQALGAHWCAAYRLHLEQPGTRRVRFVIAEVRVFPAEQDPRNNPGEWSAAILGGRARVPRGGIPARVMNQVRSRATLEKIRHFINASIARNGPELAAQALYLSEAPVSIPAPTRGRPPAMKPSEYRMFAKRYLAVEQNRETGESNRRVLANEYGVKTTTIGNWVRRCRSLGLLPKPSRRGSRLM